MSIKGLGKSLTIFLASLLMFACASNTEDQGPTETVVDQNDTEVVEDTGPSQEELERQANEAARQVRTIYFDFDDSTVKAKFQDLLRAHAWYLSRNPGVQVTIEGHCDERGTPEYNLALGERRGNSVKDILISYGVNSSQIRTVSYGEEKPANPAHNEEAWEENRRAILDYEG
ncbi:peptidoglycan-associated lipoprotein Pal [Pleionea sediminis]|uniref:peptidoglycan-associated lipoprotein Pal n=1 Tax=Pleionea sediminis TaxID=2569479 RepID=UPI001185DF2B|nr:peptidoglycan-associated lipoprotein Pal [Pleionea sediminis]